MFIIRYDGIRIAYLQSLILLREFFELKKKLWKNLKYLSKAVTIMCLYQLISLLNMVFKKRKKKFMILKIIQE